MKAFLKSKTAIFTITLGIGMGAFSYQGLTEENENQTVLAKAASTFNEVARNATPAVVSISAVKKVTAEQAASMPGGSQMPNLFGGEDQQAMGMGSGIIINSNGMILTNNHVVENAERVTVALDEKTKFTAKVIGTDPKTDLAVIQVEDPKKQFPVLQFGNSDQLQVGDWAIAIGSPFGLTQSVSFGIISAKGRGHMGILDIEDFIQTDAAINPGSSGGPLLNQKGEIIGVNTAIFSQGGGFMGIGFAVPSKIAKEVADQLIAHGRVKRGWIGVIAQDMNPELASYFKSPRKEGALISEVVDQSPAAGATIKKGDIILKYDNKDVTDATHLKSMVGKAVAGSQIPVEVSRRGATHKLNIKVREQPVPPLPRTQMAGQVGDDRDLSKTQGPRLGLAVEDVPAEVAQFLKIKAHSGAMVIGVKPGSPAFEAGFAPGDVILVANDENVKTAVDFTRIMKKAKNKDISVFYVQRGPEEKVYVPVKGKV